MKKQVGQLKADSRSRNARGRAANAQVLKSAIHLFSERGYQGTSIADIAADAGVAKANILYHFADKDALWIAAVESLWTDVTAFLDEHWPRHLGPSRALLEAILDLFIEATMRWPAYLRIPFIEGSTQSWRSNWLADRHFAAHVKTTDRVLQAMQRSGELGPGDPAQLQAMMTSSIAVLVAQSAMWDRTFDRPLSDVASLKILARLTLDKILS